VHESLLLAECAGSIQGTLYAKNVPLAAFNEPIGRKDIVFSSGTVDLTMRNRRGPHVHRGAGRPAVR
jgi:hypothetical protein